MTKVRCFDVGVGRFGYEIQWLVREILPALGVSDYEIHGFEAWSEAYASAGKELAFDSRVKLHRLAIADREGECRLFMSTSPDGHSIFATKDNVPDPTKHEVVPCSRLSVWLRQNIPDLSSALNILRFNVEGAEWPLFVDLDAEGLLPAFQIVCGACGADIRVVKELSDAGCYERFLEIVRRNGIDMFWFCWDTRNDERSKAEMQRRLQALLGG